MGEPPTQRREGPRERSEQEARVSILDDIGIVSLAPDLRRVESRLSEAIRVDDRFLGDAAGHLLSAGGKRFRPVVTLCAAYAAKGDASAHADAITGAACVELVHLGSLYHDDVLDEAGRAAGAERDALVEHRRDPLRRLSPRTGVGLAASLGAEVAGLIGATIGELCRGEVLQLQNLHNAAGATSRATSRRLRARPRSSSPRPRVRRSVSGFENATLEALTTFGRHLGMCFQLVDDVLDLTADAETLGKPTGNDLHEGVYTLPVILAAAERPELASLLGRSLDRPDVERHARS